MKTKLRKSLMPVAALLIVSIVVMWSCKKIDTTPIELIPTISSVSPTSGEIGDAITITGTNFNTAAIYNEVKIGGITTIATSATSTSLTAEVPMGAKAGVVDLSVKAYGVSTSPLDFTVIWPPPVITRCIPGYGDPGDEITINGLNFSADLADVSVTIGGLAATVLESTITSVTVEVPAITATSDVLVQILDQTSNTVSFIVPVNPATLTYTIDNTLDDVEESITRGDGHVEDGSGDLDLGKFDTGYTPDMGKIIVGVRHHDIAIPQGATIISAHLQCLADADGSDPAQVTIYAEASDNSPAFAEVDYNVSSRTLTSESVVWDMPPWTDLDSGPAQRTPDLREIIQEIVDRAGWASGGAMSFIIHATGPSADPEIGSPDGRDADAGVDKGPSLVIIYEQ